MEHSIFYLAFLFVVKIGNNIGLQSRVTAIFSSQLEATMIINHVA